MQVILTRMLTSSIRKRELLAPAVAACNTKSDLRLLQAAALAVIIGVGRA